MSARHAQQLWRVAALAAALPLCAQVVAQQPFELDISFRTTISDQNVNDMLLLQDGKVYLSGQMRWPGEPTFKGGIRLLQDGNRDWTYTSYSGSGRIMPWQDGMFFVNASGVKRYFPDAVRDLSYNTPSSGPYYIGQGSGGDFHVFEDGRVLQTGEHNLNDTVRGFTGTHRLVYRGTNGWLDTTRTHRKGNGTIWRVKAQADGRILCGGASTVYDNQAVGPVFRIHPEGDLDTTFQTATTWGNGFLYNFVPLADGRFYQCGHYGTAATGGDTLCFARFNADGTLDPTFQPPVFLSPGVPPPLVQPNVRNALVMPDGRILVHGFFRTVNGQPRNSICLLDTTGQLLAGFEDAGVGMYTYQGFTYANVNAVVLDTANNHLYLAGSYVGYDDGATNDPLQRFVTRLHLGGISTGVEAGTDVGTALHVYPNPAQHWAAMENHLPEGVRQGTLLVRDATGREVARLAANGAQGQRLWDIRRAEAGLYTVELHGDGHRLASTKLIVGQ